MRDERNPCQRKSNFYHDKSVELMICRTGCWPGVSSTSDNRSEVQGNHKDWTSQSLLQYGESPFVLEMRGETVKPCLLISRCCASQARPNELRWSERGWHSNLVQRASIALKMAIKPATHSVQSRNDNLLATWKENHACKNYYKRPRQS